MQPNSLWIITDGKTGMDVQCRGVATALGLDGEMKRVAPTGLWRTFSPWIGPAPAEQIGGASSQFAPPWPDIALATGRLSIPYLRAIRKKAKAQTLTVILQNPKVSTNSADLIWVPGHDQLSGHNVISTLTSPHPFTQRRLQELRSTCPDDIAALPGPRIAVILGGPNAVFRYNEKTCARLVGAITSLAQFNSSLMVTASRRTPEHVKTQIKAALQSQPHIYWDGEGENPYPNFLAHADRFIVTGDSVNMTGEACATGRPVHVFMPEGGSAKFSRFHDALRRYGATKPIDAPFRQLENWHYEPLDSAHIIANKIRQMWQARQSA